MRKRFMLFAVVVMIFSCFLTAQAGERAGQVSMNFDIQAGTDAGKVRLWVPYPLSDEYQRIDDVRIDGNADYYAIYREPKSGAIYLYAQWDGKKDSYKFRLSFNAFAKERKVRLKEEGEEIPAEVRKYLESNYWIPTDGKIAEIAKDIVKGRKGILEKARAIYDWVVENTYRDPNIRGCGLGIVEQTLASRGGKCADISSVYVALARAAGVPAREVFGLRLGKKPEQDITGGYHCWAEFYLPGTGWVPVDPSDVRKIMLVRKLSLKDAEPYREYYFGAVDEFRIVLERGGRGIVFNPRQDEKPLNYFMYPYAEVDGKALDYFNPKNFRYSVHFRTM